MLLKKRQGHYRSCLSIWLKFRLLTHPFLTPANPVSSSSSMVAGSEIGSSIPPFCFYSASIITFTIKQTIKSHGLTGMMA